MKVSASAPALIVTVILAGSVVPASEGDPYLTRLRDGRLVMVVYDDLYGPIKWIGSVDDGHTWFGPTSIPVDHPREPPRTIHPHGPIIEVDDGRWAFCAVWAWRKKERVTSALLVWSADRGKTWSRPIVFPTPVDGNRGLSEATIAQVAPDRYVAAIRSDEGGLGCWDGGYLRDLGRDFFDRQDPERTTHRLVKRLEALGRQVTLASRDAAA